jgi:hypothetical protein
VVLSEVEIDVMSTQRKKKSGGYYEDFDAQMVTPKKVWVPFNILVSTGPARIGP